jgi:hypothetical protein
MLQLLNKFFSSGGYIEVAVTFPGPDENMEGYVSVPVILYASLSLWPVVVIGCCSLPLL